jgi:hypothetical protein
MRAAGLNVNFTGVNARNIVTFTEARDDIDWVIARPPNNAVQKISEERNTAAAQSGRRRRALTITHHGNNMRREISAITANSMGHLVSDPTRTVGVFGQVMKFTDIDNLVRRDAIAYRIWCMRSDDPFNKWNTVESENQLFIEMLSKKLEALKWRAGFNTAWSWGVKYCYGVLLKLYDDETFDSDLSERPPDTAQITRINPICPTVVNKFNLEEDISKEDYLMLKSITVMLQSSPKTIHASRFFIVANPAPDGDMRGMSVFEPVWDDFTIKKNQDIAISATVVANVRTLPVFWFDEVDDDEMETIREELEDIRSMDSALTLRGAGPNSKIQEILGAGSLNPTPYTEYNLQNISAGTGVPMHVLLDTPAGALVASNENVKNYLSRVSNDQTKILEPIHVALIEELIMRNQIPNANFSVLWHPLEEMTFAERSQAIMRDGLGFLNYSKGLKEYVGAEGIGVEFRTEDWEIKPNEWGGFAITLKPETEPEKSYQTDATTKKRVLPTPSAIMTSSEFSDMLIDVNTLLSVYDHEFLMRHVGDVMRRVTWLAQRDGLLQPERAIRPSDVTHFFDNTLDDEDRFMRYMARLDAIKDGGVSTIRIDGSCDECKKAGNVYGVYRTGSATIPLLPIHGKDCKYKIGPY